MRRFQILKLRAAGLIPPVEAHLRVAWERTYGHDVRAFTSEHPIDINGTPPNERILKDWAEWRQAHPVVGTPVAAPLPSTGRRSICPHCGREITRGRLDWHAKACAERPRPAT